MVEAGVGDVGRVARILVVDDSAVQRDVLREMLVAAGYVVAEAADGLAALVEAKSTAPDLVITDLEMPRLHGLGLTRALRADAQFAQLPIIMLTSHTDERARLSGLDTGVDDYLAKPGSPREVLARVRNLLRLRQAMHLVEERNAQLLCALDEIKKGQERIMAAERLGYACRLAVGLCHELNNPLSALRANLGALRKYANRLVAALPAAVATQAPIQEIISDLPVLFAECRDVDERLVGVVQQFSAFVELGTARDVLTHDLRATIRDAVGHASARDSTVKIDDPPDPVIVDADREELASRLAALIGHVGTIAVDAGGVIVRVRASDAEATVQLLAPGVPWDPTHVKALAQPEYVPQGGRMTYDISLSLAREALVRLGARVSAHMADGGCLCITVALDARPG